MSYPRFDSVDQSRQQYRRNRTVQHFILDEGAAASLKCSGCGHLIASGPKGVSAPSGYGGNRCQYFPRTKKVIVFHYLCAWDNVMTRVYS